MKMTKKTFLAFVLVLTLFASLGHVTVSAMPAPKLTKLALHPEFFVLESNSEPNYLHVALIATGTARYPYVEVSGYPCQLVDSKTIWDGYIGVGDIFYFKTNIRVYGNEKTGYYTEFKGRPFTVTARATCAITYNEFSTREYITVTY